MRFFGETEKVALNRGTVPLEALTRKTFRDRIDTEGRGGDAAGAAFKTKRKEDQMLQYYRAENGERPCLIREPSEIRGDIEELLLLLKNSKKRLALCQENCESLNSLYSEETVVEDGSLSELCSFLYDEAEEAERLTAHLRDEISALREELADSLWYIKGRA